MAKAAIQIRPNETEFRKGLVDKMLLVIFQPHREETRETEKPHDFFWGLV